MYSTVGQTGPRSSCHGSGVRVVAALGLHEPTVGTEYESYETKVKIAPFSGVFGTAPLDGLLHRKRSRFGEAIICGSSKTALAPLIFTEKRLIQKKMFNKAPPHKPEPELRCAFGGYTRVL